MSVFGWITIHQRFGYADWQRPWADYKAGFGSIDADFWLGLEKVHLLTSSQPYRLRVEVQELSSNLWYSAEYWSFRIGDEVNEKYRLEVSGYSGDAGDSLQYEGDLKDGREEEEEEEEEAGGEGEEEEKKEEDDDDGDEEQQEEEEQEPRQEQKQNQDQQEEEKKQEK